MRTPAPAAVTAAIVVVAAVIVVAVVEPVEEGELVEAAAQRVEVPADVRFGVGLANRPLGLAVGVDQGVEVGARVGRILTVALHLLMEVLGRAL